MFLQAQIVGSAIGGLIFVACAYRANRLQSVIARNRLVHGRATEQDLALWHATAVCVAVKNRLLIKSLALLLVPCALLAVPLGVASPLFEAVEGQMAWLVVKAYVLSLLVALTAGLYVWRTRFVTMLTAGFYVDGQEQGIKWANREVLRSCIVAGGSFSVSTFLAVVLAPMPLGWYFLVVVGLAFAGLVTYFFVWGRHAAGFRGT